ncbi:hypothetical protein [Dactylosporangium darangshiense]|uniref:hypothetical protein n=1 Tax=Dactylosporangium darangshiense TaxID=579108 RepID=UPI0036455689
MPVSSATGPSARVQAKPGMSPVVLSTSPNAAPKPNHFTCWRTSPASRRPRTTTDANARTAATNASTPPTLSAASTACPTTVSGTGASGSSRGPRYGHIAAGTATPNSRATAAHSTGTTRQTRPGSRPSGNNTAIIGAVATDCRYIQASQDADGPPGSEPGSVTSAR